jgi:hypothetical protein
MSPIVAGDIEFRLSGGAGNTSPAASLGGAMSTAGGGVITTAVANNLWDDVTGAQSASGVTEHRAIYVKNNHGTLTWQSVVFWIDSQVSPAGSSFDVALASEAVNAPIVQTLGGESSVPSGVTFTTPTSKGTGLSIGNMAAQAFKGLWIRRVVSPGAAAASASGSIRCEGDTPA